MNDPRSISRQNFMKIQLNNLNYKLAEKTFEKVKERRQKKFNENRAIKSQEEKKKQIWEHEQQANNSISVTSSRCSERVWKVNKSWNRNNEKKEINLKFQNTDLNYEWLEKITQSLELK